MSDDWKGEHLIRGRGLSGMARRSNSMSALSNIAHEKRRRAGIPVPAKLEHDGFVTRVFRTMHQLDSLVAQDGGAGRGKDGAA